MRGRATGSKLGGVDVSACLRELGGVATTADLVALTSRDRVRRAVRDGSIARVARGRLALPVLDGAPLRAHALSGVLSHGSAVAWWGWGQKSPPTLPQVTVPKDRRVGDRAGVHFVDLRPEEMHAGIVTSPRRTLPDALRSSAYDEGLAIADSALRSGRVDHDALDRIASGARGPGSAMVRRVASAADVRAANPFESVLRALALTAELAVEPQRRVQHGREWIVPDLVDVSRRVVLEADSFAWHGNRAALRNDCRRYTWLARRGWRLLRFAWEDVMHQQEYVLEVLCDVAAPDQRTKRRRTGRSAA